MDSSVDLTGRAQCPPPQYFSSDLYKSRRWPIFSLSTKQITLLCNLWGRKSRAPSKLRAAPRTSSWWKRRADLRRRDSIGGLKSTWYWYRTHWGRDRIRKKFAVNWITEPDVPAKVHKILRIILYTNYKKKKKGTYAEYVSISNHDQPDFDSLTCSIACLVLIPASWKSRRRPPLSPSFTCWNPAEICITA